MPRSHRAVVQVLCLAVAATMADGCKSARKHHKEADKAALEAIQEKQKQIGRQEPFTIETSPDTLRRQLMINQGLTRSSDASLSSKDVTPPEHWPEKVGPKPSTQPATLPAAFPSTKPSSGVGETSATPGERSAAGAEPATRVSADPRQSDISAVEAYTPAFPPPIRLTLNEALQVGAQNSRDYQSQKERIFIDALALDLERDDFRLTFADTSVGAGVQSDQGQGQADPVNAVTGTGTLTMSRRFSNGARFLGRVSFDVVNLLTGNHDSNYGMSWNTGITVPLLRGGGSIVVLEPLTQAERNLTYDLLEFEQYKRDFAVTVASQYFRVLSQYDQIRNAEAAYRRAITSTRRARRQADAGRLPEIQVDQSVQQELRSRDRWIQAQANLGRQLDSFKQLLGLPPDANVVLDPSELAKLSSRISTIVEPETEAISETGKTDIVVDPSIATAPVRAEPVNPEPSTLPEPNSAAVDISSIELPPSSLQSDGRVGVAEAEAIRLALANRPDLQVANGQVYDAQRGVIVAANALEAEMTLQGNASSGSRVGVGSASGKTGNARPDEGVYTGSLVYDLPLERTQERNAYRRSLIQFEAAVRDLQQTEDGIKADIRSDIRDLMRAREQIQIQARSVAVAQKRVDSTNLFLEAGRAQIRDVLEAQDALVQAQNGLTSAIVDYRTAELNLQRDMGLLEVSYEGLWREYEPVLARREIKP